MNGMHYLNTTLRGLFFFALLIPWILPAAVFSQEPFYKGKTLRIIQGRRPGGTGDMRVRAVIPFLRKYIPGEPTIINEYMSGGGGRKAANYIYNSAKPDGLTLANIGAGLVGNAILGETGVRYDLDKLHFLGSPNSASHYVFLTRAAAGLDTLEKLRAAKGVRVGAQSVGHDIYMQGRLAAYLLDLKEPRFVTGYSGPEVDVALMRGEIDARANIADTIAQRTPEWIEKQLVHFHAIIEIPKGDKHPLFKNLPTLESFAKTEKDKKLLVLVRSLRLAGSPYILPPATPKEQIQILQDAFRKIFKDPNFAKEFKKMSGDDPTPLVPEKAEEAIREIPRDPQIIAFFKKLASAEPLPSR